MVNHRMANVEPRQPSFSCCRNSDGGLDVFISLLGGRVQTASCDPREESHAKRARDFKRWLRIQNALISFYIEEQKGKP